MSLPLHANPLGPSTHLTTVTVAGEICGSVPCVGLQIHSSLPATSANNSNGGDLATPAGVPSSVADLAAGSNLTKLGALLDDAEFQASGCILQYND